MPVSLFFARFSRSGHTIQQCEKNWLLISSPSIKKMRHGITHVISPLNG